MKVIHFNPAIENKDETISRLSDDNVELFKELSDAHDEIDRLRMELHSAKEGIKTLQNRISWLKKIAQ